MSGWGGTCELITLELERDEYGVRHQRQVRRKVFCNVFSLGNAAYYAAAQAGVRTEAVLQVRRTEYRGERLVAFGGEVLSVARANEASPDFVVLTLEEKAGNHG